MGSNNRRRGATFSRRSYLGAVGATTVGMTVPTTVAAGSDYENVVDIVEEGADNSGQRPIDNVFSEHADDDTLIKFREGRYLVNKLSLWGLNHFAMVGKDATLVPGDNYKENWIGGAEVEDLRIENFTIDTTEQGVAPEMHISAYDGLVIRNLFKKGRQNGNDTAFDFWILNENGTGLVENLSAPDGGNSCGVYVHGNNKGQMTFRNCQIEGFVGNGLYASHGSGPIKVEGGTFRNNGVAQVRLGSANSYVKDATIEVNRRVPQNQENINMRGVRVSDGPGPVTVENCDIRLENSEGDGGVQGAFNGGSFNVLDTRIFVGSGYTIVGADNSSSWAIYANNVTEGKPGTRTVKNVSITGNATGREAIRLRRDDNTLRNICIQQPGDDRDGIRFEDSQNNAVSDSTINVSGDAFVLHNSSVRRHNNTFQGSCPTPGDDQQTTQSSDSTSESPGAQIGRLENDFTEAGEWTSVDLDGADETPVVLAQPMSYNGPDPSHVRLQEVSGDAFRYRFEEWMYLNHDVHWFDRADFVAIGEGTYQENGRGIEVGHLKTNHQFSTASFDQGFDGAPVVLAQPQTYNGPNPIVTRLRNVSSDGAQIRVQEEEGEEHGGWHRVERVGYMALEPGTGSLFGRQAEVGTTGPRVTDSWATIEFEQSYDDPRFLADIQTFNGPQTATIRYRNLDASSVEVFVEEEQSKDPETSHRPENVGYLVVESN